MKFIIKVILTGLFIAVLSNFMKGIHVPGLLASIVVALVLAVLNAVVKPILILLTLPVTIVTLGLFLLVINAAMVLLCAEIVDGFKVDSFWYALLFSILVSLFQSLVFGTSVEKRQNRN
ncbi:phage holin family protein [Flavobacterium sp. 3HN19-14]|uniref:phage holin family protein n=1 Tax=Flavobacterium sp. 3HN19-14 TaxID=3448133 RepID=UPI003EE081F9